MRRIYLSKRAVEGDNRIIEQEVATYLVNKMTECVQNSGATPQAPTEELLEGYLCSCAQHTPPSFSAADGSIDDGALVHIFRWCTAALASHHTDSYHILVSTFHAALYLSSVSFLSNPTPSVLRTCFRLFACHTLSQPASSISASDLQVLHAKILEVVGRLLPQAVKLVDAWAVPDWLSDSYLGRYDGIVYEHLFDQAHRKDPLNRTTFKVDWRSDEVVLGSRVDGGRRLLAKYEDIEIATNLGRLRKLGSGNSGQPCI
ncbi:hypothetical protein PMIN05_007986 [Paraphaeosphaeria minitans]